jgi:hypothetical protein
MGGFTITQAVFTHRAITKKEETTFHVVGIRDMALMANTPASGMVQTSTRNSPTEAKVPVAQATE